MAGTTVCPLCGIECEIFDSTIPFSKAVNCKRCGDFNISERAIRHLDQRKNKLYTISGVIRNFSEQHKDSDDSNPMFAINDEMITDNTTFQTTFVNKEPKTISEKTSLLLQYIARNSNEKPGTSVLITIDDDYPIVFGKDKDELYFYINYLDKRGFFDTYNINSTTIRLQGAKTKYKLSLTFEGWVEIEKLQKPNIESKQVFIAMCFAPELNEIFDQGIEPLGDKDDESYTGFNMYRVDKESFNNEKICDKIVAEIKKSRFLIADVTKHRPAVYFEAGYAMAMGLPVIWTCKDEQKEKDDCCFDTRQYPHIFWKDAHDLKNRLKNKIMADIITVK